MNWEEYMAPLGTYWTDRCDEISKREGWALFDADGVLQIQAIDDPEECDAYLKGRDGEAYSLIAGKALSGSKLHALALYLEGRPVPQMPQAMTPEQSRLAAGRSDKEDIYVPRNLLEETA